MKVILTVLLLVGILSSEISKTPTKYQVTYTITFNAISLEEAGKIEKEIRSNYQSACGLKIDVQDVYIEWGTESRDLWWSRDTMWIEFN